jgi:hypothetical protein
MEIDRVRVADIYKVWDGEVRKSRRTEMRSGKNNESAVIIRTGKAGLRGVDMRYKFETMKAGKTSTKEMTKYGVIDFETYGGPDNKQIVYAGGYALAGGETHIVTWQDSRDIVFDLVKKLMTEVGTKKG